MIQLHDKQFVPFISAKEINFALEKMVAQIEDDFFNENCISYYRVKNVKLKGFSRLLIDCSVIATKKASRILHEFLNLPWKVIPLRISRFYEFEFLFSVSSFELFFSLNGSFDRVIIFIIHTDLAVILELLHNALCFRHCEERSNPY